MPSLARVRRDLIGHKHIDTVADFISICVQLSASLTKLIPVAHSVDSNRYNTLWRLTRQFILAWTREFTCEDCGLVDPNRSLHFHHVDATTKVLNVGSSNSPFDARLLESLKCIYLCETCHYKEHSRLGDLDGYFNTINRRGYSFIQSLLGMSERD